MMSAKTEGAGARACWFVGAAFGGTDDQTARFLEESIWEIRNPSDKEVALVKSMQPGDSIAIKSAYVRKHNLPFDNLLKNIYTEGSFGFGFNNSKTEDGSGEVTDNASVMNWRLGARYTYFVSEHFSLSPMFGYGSQSLKYKNDDLKTANGGIYAGVGWNFHLR